MRLAPLPEHNRVNDLAWKAMYDAYEPLITPLRRRQLITDIDTCGPATVIYSQLPDGSFLRIGTTTTTDDGGLPAGGIDNVTSWLVVRESDDNPTVRHLVYDSTPHPDNLYGRNGALIAPLLLAVDAFLDVRKMPGGPSDHRAVVTIDTIHETGPAGFATSQTFKHAVEASDRHKDLLVALIGDGLTTVHDYGVAPFRRTVLAAGDRVQILTTTLAELVPGGRAALRCFCLLAHPQTPEEDARLQAEIEQARSIGDANGVYVGLKRLATAPNCPARPKGTARV
ncbi:hypothetical protein ACFV4P_03010 [Kitasatospora sp. NPDC059795]|uniref:hypothetical protein n=1 Tax=Kitasatospora sp. NPDC059795 TaxID=3346949 RepID=UPI0036647243